MQTTFWIGETFKKVAYIYKKKITYHNLDLGHSLWILETFQTLWLHFETLLNVYIFENAISNRWCWFRENPQT